MATDSFEDVVVVCWGGTTGRRAGRRGGGGFLGILILAILTRSRCRPSQIRSIRMLNAPVFSCSVNKRENGLRCAGICLCCEETMTAEAPEKEDEARSLVITCRHSGSLRVCGRGVGSPRHYPGPCQHFPLSSTRSFFGEAGIILA